MFSGGGTSRPVSPWMMISGRTARLAGDDRFLGQRRFDVDQAKRLAVRWQAHHVDRAHEVGHIATEAEQFEAVGDAKRLRGGRSTLVAVGRRQSTRIGPPACFRKTNAAV